MLHKIKMYRHVFFLSGMLLPTCRAVTDATREHLYKHTGVRPSCVQRLGVLFLLTIAGLGTYSNTCALEGPVGVNNDIKLWLDANPKYLYKDSTCSNKVGGTGDAVHCWEDRSGNGAHTIQYFSRGLPTYAAHTINGQPVLQFNKATRDGLWHQLASLDRWSGAYTLFLVVQQRDPVSSIGSFQSYFSNGNRRANHFQLAHGKNAHASSVWVWTSNSGSSTKFESSSLEPRIYVASHQDDTTITTYTNGRKNQSRTSSNGRDFDHYKINLNRRGNAGNASYIAEVALYSRTLDDCEFYDVYKYLLDKYGIPDETMPEGASALHSIYQEFLDMNEGIDGTTGGDYIRVDGTADSNIRAINASGGDDIVYIKGWGAATNSSVDGSGGNDTLIIDSSIYSGKTTNKVTFTTGGDITYNNFSKVVSSSDFPFETTGLEEPKGCDNECPSGNTAPVGVPAAVSFSSRSLGSDTLVFQGQFDFDDWSGDLVAYELEDDGSLGDQKWRAAEMLESKDLSTTTDWTSYNDHAIATSKGQKFEWSELDTAQQDDLNASDNKGSERLNYLRGDDSNEAPDGLNFRQRSSRLGDVFRSRPVYVGVPNLAWPDTGAFDYGEATRYSDFSTAQQSRPPMVYVGANDGALHGFHAETGNEVLRYFPGDLYEASDKAGYHFLTDPDYDHLPYVDGTPVVSDAYIKTSDAGEKSWRTILVGTQGGGGSGLFALDITEPDIFNDDGTSADNVVLWEFTQDNFADLGYTYSRPTVALLNDGRWAAITGNGDTDDGLDGYLLILYLEGGIDDWSGGGSVDDYIAIPTNEFGGLSSPTVIDTDGDGDGDRAYAGDAEGNLWVFDLSSEDSDDWEVANGGDPLFENTRDDPQPITVKPTVVRHPTVSSDATNAPNVMVLFGTGRLNTEDDKSDTTVQTFYGIWDRGDKNLTAADDLAAQEFVFEDENTRITNPSLEVNYKGSEYGWYIDLLTDTNPIGERVVSDAVVRGDMIFFNTVIPTEDPCEYGGTGWEMSVRIENGGSSMSPVVDQNDDGLFNNEDSSEVNLAGDSEPTAVGHSGKKVEDDEGLPGGPAIVGDKLFTRGSKEGEQPKDTALAPVTGSTPVGRLSWEQLFPSQ